MKGSRETLHTGKTLTSVEYATDVSHLMATVTNKRLKHLLHFDESVYRCRVLNILGDYSPIQVKFVQQTVNIGSHDIALVDLAEDSGRSRMIVEVNKVLKEGCRNTRGDLKASYQLIMIDPALDIPT